MRMRILGLAAVLVLAIASSASAAGHIQPTGLTKKAASQLVAWYDESEENSTLEGFSVLQVTNLSNDTAVNIHVQIFADNIFESTDRCREHNFTDTLTPTDTVTYCIGNLNLDDDPEDLTQDDWSCGGNNAGAPVPINVDETRGFIVVTAVNQATLPREAISHNYLIGTMTIFISQDSPTGAMKFNAMGRPAVNFATGAETAPGTLLDGIVNGYTLLQPDFFQFGFTDYFFSPENANVVSIAFSDNYSDPAGEYRAEAATAVWDPLMFDQFEQGTSCQQHIQTCFVDIGLNDDWGTSIEETETDFVDVRLCPAVSLDGTGGFSDNGWVNIAVSGLSGLENNLGIFSLNESDSSAFADWMHTE